MVHETKQSIDTNGFLIQAFDVLKIEIEKGHFTYVIEFHGNNYFRPVLKVTE